MQLNTIALQSELILLRETARTETLFSDDRASRHYDDLVDRLIDVKRLLSRRRFLDVLAHAADDIFRSIGVPYDTA